MCRATRIMLKSKIKKVKSMFKLLEQKMCLVNNELSSLSVKKISLAKLPAMTHMQKKCTHHAKMAIKICNDDMMSRINVRSQFAAH